MCFFVAPFVNYDLRYRCFILEQILPKGPDRQIATSCDVNLREKKKMTEEKFISCFYLRE